jgi:hypothetical protein
VNAVLTSLLTSTPDPQRGVKWPADPAPLGALLGSLTNCDPVVFVDELEPPDRRFVIVPPGGNPYTYRWHLVRDWLVDNPDAGFVWAVDGSDVEMLREPWGEMCPGVLYVGSEPHPVRNQWMIHFHPASHNFIAAHSNHRLLNSGIAGGDRDTLLDFTTRLCRRLDEVAGVDAYDMGAFNEVGWTEFAARMVTGERVHTIFRLDDRTNRFAWWKHK